MKLKSAVLVVAGTADAHERTDACPRHYHRP